MKFSSTVLSLLFLFFSCDDTRECSEYPAHEWSFRFMIIDPVSGDNLIGAWGRRYDSDDVIFYDEFGAPIDRTFGDGTFYFAPVIDPPAPIDTLLKKTFLLDLPPWTGYNRTDTDTIQIELILKPAECPKIEYNNLKVFYNDILFFDGIPSDGEKFTFHKE